MANARFFRAATHSRSDARSSAQHSLQKTLKDLNPYAQAVGMIVGIMSFFAGAASYVTVR
jgi:hypothetical protein